MAARLMKRTGPAAILMMALMLTMAGNAEDSAGVSDGAAAGHQNSVQVIAPGDSTIDTSILKPYMARYQGFTIKDGKKTPAGPERISHLQEAKYPGGEGMRLIISLLGGTTVSDENQFLKTSLAPTVRIISVSPLLHRVEVFQKGKIRGANISPQGKVVEVELDINETRFHMAVKDLVLASLPLKEGYQARLPVFSSDLLPNQMEPAPSDSAKLNLILSIKVIGKERIRTGTGNTYDTWIVESNLLTSEGEPLKLPNGVPFPGEKIWIAKEPPYAIKSGAGGMSIELIGLK